MQLIGTLQERALGIRYGLIVLSAVAVMSLKWVSGHEHECQDVCGGSNCTRGAGPPLKGEIQSLGSELH